MTSVCIDGMNLALAKGSGIATYGHNLLGALSTAGFGTQVLYGPAAPRHSNPLLNEIALADAGAPQRQKAGFARSVNTLTARFGRTAYPVPTGREIIWPEGAFRRPEAENFWASTDLYNLSSRAFKLYRTFTPIAFRSEQSGQPEPDVVHWTCPMPVQTPHAPNIYTFHDLIPLRLPSTTLDDKRAFHDLCLRVIDRADHIVTVSEQTRQDLIRMLGAPEDKVTNTYQSVAIPDAELAMDDIEATRQVEGLFGLDWKGYFLFFGAVDPKKNIARLVEAYLGLGTSTPLVLVTGRSWLADREMTLVNNALENLGPGQTTGIRQMDYLPAGLLNLLIRGAKATLFPSLYEGFGLPILESMLRGTAVLSSTAGSIPEIAGDAAILVDPTSVDAIRQGLAALDADATLREDLERRGRSQASLFDKPIYQARLTEAYRAAGVTLPKRNDPL